MQHYWATHLHRTTDPLGPEVEADLTSFLTTVRSFTWIECLAILTGPGFPIAMGRIVELVKSFCGSKGSLVNTATRKLLEQWAESCEDFWKNWGHILKEYPSEVHYIDQCLLSRHSIFRTYLRPASRAHFRESARKTLEEADRAFPGGSIDGRCGSGRTHWR